MSFAGLAASFGAFLWVHPPTAYQFLLVFGVCLLVPAIRAGKWRELCFVAAALVFGSMLAAAYFYPAIVEQHLVNGDDVERVWPYHASYVFDYSQAVYDRINNPFFIRLDRIWVFNLVAILVCAIAVLSFKQRRARVWLWIAAGLLASFLMTKLSAPIGRFIPSIGIGVYSWRMLTLTSFAMAMLTGLVLRGGTEPGAVATGSFSTNDIRSNLSLPLRVPYQWMILLSALAMSGYYVAWPMWRAQSFEPNYEHYNYATLPRGASRDNPPMEPVQLVAGKGSISAERWTPEFRQLRVSLNQADQLQFRTRNFAGWTATIDGQIAPIREGSIKNILLDLPAGEHRITLEYRSTPIRRLSNWITVISFAILLSIIIFNRRNS